MLSFTYTAQETSEATNHGARSERNVLEVSGDPVHPDVANVWPERTDGTFYVLSRLHQYSCSLTRAAYLR